MDFYVILGLEQGASIREVKRAYRRLARRFHPDINPGDHTAATIFRQVVEAYETLSDPDRRRRYDSHLAEPTRTPSAYEFEGFDFTVAGRGAAEGTFGELFADVLRRDADAAAERPEHGADLHARLAISFDQAMTGGEWPVTVTRLEACHACRGTGAVPTLDSRCPHCHGSGTVKWARGHMVFSKNCAPCGGTGRLGSRACPVCAREGVLARAQTVTVRVPPGVADGAQLRVPRQGHVGRRGGHTGHLYVTVDVAPHPLFRREGGDLHLVVPVAVHEAGLGAKIEVPTIDGPARLRVPPGTQSGQRFRLRGRGAPSVRDGRRGDLVVEARIVLPRVIDERSKELLRELGRRQDEDVRGAWRGRAEMAPAGTADLAEPEPADRPAERQETAS